jgi:hypothetical protein
MKKLMILGLGLTSVMALAQKKTQMNLQVNVKPLSKVEISYQPASYPTNFMVLIHDSTGKTVFLENQFRTKQPYSHLVDLAKYGANKFFVQLKGDEGEIKQTITLK